MYINSHNRRYTRQSDVTIDINASINQINAMLSNNSFEPYEDYADVIYLTVKAVRLG